MITTSIRLSEENKAIVDNLSINLSKYVKDKLEEDYVDLESLNRKVKIIDEEKEILTALIKKISAERKNLSAEEKEYIRESKPILEKYNVTSVYFRNRFNGFIMNFNKKFMKIEDFEQLVLTE